MVTSSQGEESCPLCGTQARAFVETPRSAFSRCPACMLTFRHRRYWPAPEAERARYQEHHNSPGDPRYVSFLRRLVDPLCARLEGPKLGLDFGSGPSPVLSSLMRDEGHEMCDYDPFFAPDSGALAGTYDFITCCEVLEHMHRPLQDLMLIDRLLRPGGILGVMTGMVDDRRDFSSWSYVRDATHVAFFHPATMQWICDRLGWTIDAVNGDATIFRKPG